MFQKVWNRWRFILQCRMFCVMVFLGVWLGKEWSFFSSKCFVGRLIMLPELCDNFCYTKAQSRKVSIQELLSFGHPLLLLIFFFFFCNSSYSCHPFEIGKERSLLFSKVGAAMFSWRKNFQPGKTSVNSHMALWSSQVHIKELQSCGMHVTSCQRGRWLCCAPWLVPVWYQKGKEATI